MLLHRSGLQSEQPVVDPRKATFLRADEVLGMLDRVRVAVPPESAFKYSNLGYEFLGEAVRRLSGLPANRVRRGPDHWPAGNGIDRA